MPQSLRATIGRKTIDLFSTLRHWNLRNLTLQKECYLTSTRDFFRNPHGSIMLPPRQPRVFARLGSLAIIQATLASHVRGLHVHLVHYPAIWQVYLFPPVCKMHSTEFYCLQSEPWLNLGLSIEFRTLSTKMKEVSLLLELLFLLGSHWTHCPAQYKTACVQ